MCIIVDANAAHHVVNKTDAGAPVLQWLLDRRRKAGLVLGGKLSKELYIKSFLPTLVELSRANRIHSIPDKDVEVLSNSIRSSCKSNDSHVVALAILSKCSVVFTADNELHADLKRLSPSGARIAVYQTSAHKHLLTSCECN